MKAVIYTRYGSPDVLKVQDLPRPEPKENEVLIRVRAVGVNLSDWEGLTGRPLYARFGGLFKPSKTILGSDVAGVIEAVGSAVTRFKPGDAVFGDALYQNQGCFAEYVCTTEKPLALKPDSLSFVDAAALPQPGVIALQGVRDKGQIQPGMKVLINGAGGGTGVLAVQLAKMYGTEVTAVDNAEKLDMLRSLGADHLIDYRRENFTRNGQQYDFILDLAAYHSVQDYARSLKPNGSAYLVGGSVGTMLMTVLLGARVGKAQGKQVRILAVSPNTQDLLAMVELCEAGKLHPVIDRTFTLDETADALRYLGEGHARGKIVVTV